MTLTARQVALTFAAEVAEMPVHGDVNPELLTQFVSFLHRYRVLVIPEAAVDPAALVAFSRRFGPLEIHSRFDATLPMQREIFCVGNVERDGMKASFNRGVEQWHADSSYRDIPSDASLFQVVIVPDEGGDTLFVDATAAYRALDAGTKQRIEGLRAVHSLETLRGWNAARNPDRAPQAAAQVAAYPPVRHPLVRVHPASAFPVVVADMDGLGAGFPAFHLEGAAAGHVVFQESATLHGALTH